MTTNERTDKNLPLMRLPKAYKCKYCGKKFISFYNLAQHIDKDHREIFE